MYAIDELLLAASFQRQIDAIMQQTSIGNLKSLQPRKSSTEPPKTLMDLIHL